MFDVLLAPALIIVSIISLINTYQIKSLKATLAHERAEKNRLLDRLAEVQTGVSKKL